MVMDPAGPASTRRTHTGRGRVARGMHPEEHPVRFGSLTAAYGGWTLLLCSVAILVVLVVLPRWRAGGDAEAARRSTDTGPAGRAGRAFYSEGGSGGAGWHYRFPGAETPEAAEGVRRRLGRGGGPEAEPALVGRGRQRPAAGESRAIPPLSVPAMALERRSDPPSDRREEEPQDEAVGGTGESNEELLTQAAELEERAHQTRQAMESQADELEQKAAETREAAERSYALRRGTLRRIHVTRQDETVARERAEQLRAAAVQSEERLLEEAHRLREQAQGGGTAEPAAGRVSNR